MTRQEAPMPEQTDTQGTTAIERRDRRLRDEYQRFYDFVGDCDPSIVDAWHFTENAKRAEAPMPEPTDTPRHTHGDQTCNPSEAAALRDTVAWDLSCLGCGQVDAPSTVHEPTGIYLCETCVSRLRTAPPAPEPDAALRDQLRLVRDLAGHRSRDIDHDCFAMNCRALGDEVEQLRAALARPTPALDVLDIRWLLDNSIPMHYQGCDPDGCSCGVAAKYEAIIDRQAVREERAARATESGTL